jgi:hypothetical protein
MIIIQTICLFLLFPSVYYIYVYVNALVSSAFMDFSATKGLLFSLFVFVACLITVGVMPVLTTGIF